MSHRIQPETAGFVAFDRDKTYAAFKPAGAKDGPGGSWKVAANGEVTLVAGAGAGPETQSIRLAMTARDKAAGFRWTRKDDSVPYRKDSAVELVKEK